VLVAALVNTHLHHVSSMTLIDRSKDQSLAVAAHSYAEAYAVLTRRAPAPYQFRSSQAWQALESVAAITKLVGLSPAQTVATIREFATDGNTGPMIYDKLIGAAASYAGITQIVTWNVKHLAILFPHFDVVTPETLLARGAII